MKLFALFSIALAQDSGPGDGSRAMSLDKKISNAQVKCNYYMQKALDCEPPSSKISKYNHRIEKVLLDAKHHLEADKCEKNAAAPSPYRKRRQAEEDLFSADDEFTALEEEIEEFGAKGKYGNAANNDQIERLKGVCEKVRKKYKYKQGKKLSSRMPLLPTILSTIARNSASGRREWTICLLI